MKRPCSTRRPAASALLIGLCLSMTHPVPAIGEDLLAPPERRVAQQFARAANELLRIEPTTVPGLELAAALYEIAESLDPNRPELTRSHLEVARLTEDTELQHRLLATLAKLDPRDQPVRLQRVNAALARYQTAEELIAAYEKLLTEETRQAIGSSISSRLAFDLAILHRRREEPERFAHWLAVAAELDETNKPAAAMAAGYFQMQIDDPFAQAELLVNLLLADPTDIATHAALSRHLLTHGVYEGAARILRLRLGTFPPLGAIAPHDLIADVALAEWGAGRGDDAWETIRSRERSLDEATRRAAWEKNPNLTATERAQITQVLPLSLAAVKLAIMAHNQDERLADELAEQRAGILAILDESTELPDEVRGQSMMALWLLEAWFGGDVAILNDLRDRVERVTPIADHARTRMDGWVALHEGNYSRAEELLKDIENDPIARLGLARVRFASGQTDEAAAVLHDLALSEPGSLIGVWAGKVCRGVTGEEPHPPDRDAMNDLIAALPRTIDRMPVSSARIVSLRVEPVKRTFTAFEPVLVRITVINNSGLPLGVAPDGPLHPKLVIQPRLTLADDPRLGGVAPLVIDIGRRLRIDSRDRIEVEIDLRETSLGTMLDRFAARGVTIELVSTLNPRVTSEGLVAPGLLGATYRTPLFRLDGVTPTMEWMDTLARTVRESEEPRPLDVAVLAQWTGRLSETAFEEVRRRVDAASTAVAGAYTRLPPLDRAWLAGVITPNQVSLEPLVRAIQADPDPLVQIASLMTNPGTRDSPMLQAAQRSSDPQLRRIGDLVAQLLKEQEDIRGAAETPPDETRR